MVFKDNAPLYATELERRQGEDVMYINFMSATFVPSISDNPAIMARVIDLLAENSEVSRMVFVQQRNYNYAHEQITLLSEIARIYNFLVKQESILSVEKLGIYGNVSEIYEEMTYIVTLLKQDPLNCHLYLKNKIQKTKSLSAGYSISYLRFLEHIFVMLDQTKLIRQYLLKFEELSYDSTETYRYIFRPDILP